MNFKLPGGALSESSELRYVHLSRYVCSGKWCATGVPTGVSSRTSSGTSGVDGMLWCVNGCAGGMPVVLLVR